MNIVPLDIPHSTFKIGGGLCSRTRATSQIGLQLATTAVVSLIAIAPLGAQSIPATQNGVGNNLTQALPNNQTSAADVITHLDLPGLVQHILVTAGSSNVSVVNGLLQITNGNANSFLFTSTGTVLRLNSSLNVPAAFQSSSLRSTAFGDGIGTRNNSPNALSVTPEWLNGIAQPPPSPFDRDRINGTWGWNGQIAVTALPEQNLVRLSQPGSLLQLEIPAIDTQSGERKIPVGALNGAQVSPFSLAAISPLSLPQLLTGGNEQHATTIVVTQGTVQLIGSTAGLAVIHAGSIIHSSTDALAPAPIESIAPINREADNREANNREADKQSDSAARLLPITSGAVRLPMPSCMDAGVAATEVHLSQFYQHYLGISTDRTVPDNCKILNAVQKKTGIKTAILYATFVPVSLTVDPDQDQLELVLVSSDGRPIRQRISAATRNKMVGLAKTFRHEVSDPSQTDSDRYKDSAQQLYQWLIAPIEADLKTRGIQNITFILDTELSSMPLAALYDGIHRQFLIQKYSIGLMPNWSLTDTRYTDIRRTQVLAMGRSIFTDRNQSALPAVPIELFLITTKLWSGKRFLNQEFTLPNLVRQHQQNHFGIIHLATHGEFQPDPSGLTKVSSVVKSETVAKQNVQSPVVDHSYIQFWDTKLRPSQLRQLKLDNPPVELLVLSACRTALGDTDTELGFAGLAVQFGVKSAIASLWYVSDTGTLGLVIEFYQRLRNAPIKAEALRQAQVAMLSKQVTIQHGQLRWTGGDQPLPPGLPTDADLSHPYYWASFTLVGNPW